MKEKVYWRWGLTIIFSVCAILVFYDTFFQSGAIFQFLRRLSRILAPVIYGFALAYLLAPIVDVFDRPLLRTEKIKNPMLARAVSILLTWVIVFALLYALLRIMIPQLYHSVLTLFANANSYYRTVYLWASQLLEDNPDVSGWVTSGIQTFYRELVAWVTDTWIPQAQQAVVLVTGGFLRVVLFFKDLLVGVVVSVYMLATKERFARRAKKLLYSAVREPTYEAVLRAARKTDEIFSGFVRGKLLDSLIIGVLCFIGATILQLPYAPLVSTFIGITNVIPFFGPFLGAIPSALLILLVSPLKCLYFILFILALQQLDGNVIGPRILGSSTNLSGFWVIVAILIGGGFFGVAGMFLGVPVFACFYAAVQSWSRKRLRERGVTDERFAPPPPAAKGKGGKAPAAAAPSADDPAPPAEAPSPANSAAPPAAPLSPADDAER